VTLPQLRPILLINTILISIFTLNNFDLILPLTGGGPGRATEVLSLYAYNTVFRNFDLSNGAVLAVVLLLISLAFTFFYVRLCRRRPDRCGCRSAHSWRTIGTYLAYRRDLPFLRRTAAWLISPFDPQCWRGLCQQPSHLARTHPTFENYISVMKNALLPVYLWNRPQALRRRRVGGNAVRDAGSLRPVAFSLPPQQGW